MNRRESNRQSNMSLCGSILDLFRVKPSKRGNTQPSQKLTVNYESLEERRVLASLFPTYIDGNFTLGDANGASPYALADTFKLESNPNATKTIYLDFDGHHSVNNAWGHDIVFPSFDRDGNPNNFSTAELIEIQLQFQNVAEDFLPFDVNVTTKDPGLEALRKTSSGDQRYGIRAVNTQATDGFGGFGGVAYLNSFDDSIDNPVFTLNKGANNGAMTNSHEVGHALGLRHDGLGSRTYHPGTGSGEISWGPIMGAPFGENITQWSNGDYSNSTNTEDDLSIITKTANGFGFRADDYGSSIASASALDVDTSDFSVSQWGIVERNTDRDFFRFTTGDGQINLDINAFGERPNLDILARLYDSNGSLIATSNPSTGVDASFNRTLNAGTYYVSIEGTGNANSSSYGSLGFYTISGQLIEPTDSQPIGESGTINNLNHVTQTVRLNGNYVNPVVVVGPASRIGGDPVTIRVSNVTSNSFDVVIDEWEYRDVFHIRESASFIVVEAGVHTLEDGTVLQAGNQNDVNHRFRQLDFASGTFSSTPLVFTQTTTNNDSQAVATRARSIDSNGFQVRLQEEEGADRVHGLETVSWIAIEEVGVGNLGNGAQFQASQTGNSVTHRQFSGDFDANFSNPPVFIAAMQTFDGGDVSTVRSFGVTADSYTINIEEERSLNAEVGHTTESVGMLVLPSGQLNGQTGGGGNVGPQNAPAAKNPLAYESGTDTTEAWEAYKEMLSWGEDTTPLGHEHDHEHEHDDDHDHEHELEHDHEHDHEHDDHDHDHDHMEDNIAADNSRANLFNAKEDGPASTLKPRQAARTATTDSLEPSSPELAGATESTIQVLTDDTFETLFSDDDSDETKLQELGLDSIELEVWSKFS